MKINKYRWELAKILRFDQMVTILLTLKCNQKCWYCCQSYVDQGEHQEQDYKFWIDFIDKKKIKVVSISGGECALYNGVEHIINHCIEKKILVSVVTNLKTLIPNIKKSWRVIFLASYHEGMDLKNFMTNYTTLSRKFHVTVRELHKDSNKIIPFSQVEIIKTDWRFGDSKCPYYTYYPDGTLIPKYNVSVRDNNFTYRFLDFLRKISGYKNRFT